MQTAKLSAVTLIALEMKSLAVYNLSLNRDNAIRVSVPRLDNPFVAETLKGIRETAGQSGYQLIIAHSAANGTPQTTGIRVKPAEAAVVFSAGPAGPKGVVTIDNSRCGYLAAEHLVAQGCTQPAMISSWRENKAGALRYAGFSAALRKHSMARQGEWRITGDIHTEPGTAEVIRRLLRMTPRPDGLFITDDRAAARCINMLDEMGLSVPGDIAIVGFNNEPVSRLISPALTTIAFPAFEMGRAAASGLLEGFSGRIPTGHPVTTILPPTLIIRASSQLSNKMSR